MVNDTNTDLETEGQLSGEVVKNPPPIEVNIVIDKAGIQKPSKSIGEMLDEFPKSVSGEVSETNIIVSTPVYEQCFADMKTKKTPKFKQKILLEVEEAEWKGVGQGGGKPHSPGRAPPSGRTPKGSGRVPTSSKPMGVPGRHSSDHKHNPFLALATVARQSVKAAKRKLPPWDDNNPDYDDGDEWKRARKGSDSVGKAPHKQLPCKLPKKKPGIKSKLAFTGAIKKPHRFHPGTVAL